MKKLLMFVIPSLMVLCLAFVGTIMPAHASAKVLPILICTGTQTVTYTPGITNDKKMTHLDINDDYSSCTNILGPNVTKGKDSFTVEEDTSCIAATDLVDNLVTYDWLPGGQSSTIDFPITNVDYLSGGGSMCSR